MRYAILILAIIGQLVSSDQQSSLSSACADFSQRLYQKIALDMPNVIYSPYSIHSVLTMTSLGARGETLTEMRDTLGITSLGDSVHGIYRDLIQQLNSATGVQIRTGNAIFVKQSYTIEPTFTSETKDKYFAKVSNINMSAAGGPQKPINDYIALQTNNMIKDVLAPGQITSNTLILLINTLYFNGTWEKPFVKALTKFQDFKLPRGTIKKVEMMKSARVVNIKRGNSNGVDVAELPFTGGRFNLYIALPRKVDGITDLEKLLAQTGKVQDLFSGLISESVDLAIPKFKTESTIQLLSALQNLGISHALSPLADFKGITSRGPVFISDVVHKAVIDVQETGTVAAAATVVSVSRSSVVTRGSFIADRPFVYFLRDKVTGQILFQGKFSG